PEFVEIVRPRILQGRVLRHEKPGLGEPSAFPGACGLEQDGLEGFRRNAWCTLAQPKTSGPLNAGNAVVVSFRLVPDTRCRVQGTGRWIEGIGQSPRAHQ